MEDEEKIRKEYLIQYRNGLWTQIRAKEDSVWRFISFFAAALVIIAGFLKPNTTSSFLLTPVSAILLDLAIFVVSFWGLLIVLDSNFWMQRNLVFVSNIEKDLLTSDDFGLIIPKSYVEPGNFRYAISYFIQIIFLSITILVALLAFTLIAIKNPSTGSHILLVLSQLASIAFCSLLTYTIHRNRKWIKDYESVKHQAPGKALDKKRTYDTEVNERCVFWSSDIESFLFFFSIMGSAAFVFGVLRMQSIFAFIPSVDCYLFFFSLLITFLFLATKSILRKDYRKTLDVIDSETSETKEQTKKSHKAKLQRLIIFQKFFQSIQIFFLGACTTISICFLFDIILLKLHEMV